MSTTQNIYYLIFLHTTKLEVIEMQKASLSYDGELQKRVESGDRIKYKDYYQQSPYL